MQFKRTFIAFCLLFAYSLGFSHNLVPHCHHAEGVTEHGNHSGIHSHEHEHHHHNELSAEELAMHEHVAHEDHFDDSLIEFIICVLSDTEHPAFENCQINVEANTISLEGFDNIKLVATFAAVFTVPAENIATVIVAPEVDIAFLSPPLDFVADRGPPSFFCSIA